MISIYLCASEKTVNGTTVGLASLVDWLLWLCFQQINHLPSYGISHFHLFRR